MTGKAGRMTKERTLRGLLTSLEAIRAGTMEIRGRPKQEVIANLERRIADLEAQGIRLGT